MQDRVVQRLREVNQEFYQSFGEAFAETRQRVQPGVARVLRERVHDGDWLDLGCGSGAILKSWVSRGLRGSYHGVDLSQPLLTQAGKVLAALEVPEGLKVQFSRLDLLTEGWNEEIQPSSLDGVLAFAMLHHIPGGNARRRLVSGIRSMLKPGGSFIHSNWQFQHSPKLMQRVQPWELIGLEADEVEEGDTLLDWRHAAGGGRSARGLRYVHLFSRGELADLASATGFTIIDEFESDGLGGRLGLYQVWRKN